MVLLQMEVHSKSSLQKHTFSIQDVQFAGCVKLDTFGMYFHPTSPESSKSKFANCTLHT